VTELTGLLLLAAIVAFLVRWVARRDTPGVDGALSRAVDAFRLGEGLAAEEELTQLRESVRGWRACRKVAQVLMDAGALEPALEFARRGLEDKPNDAALRRVDTLLRASLLDKEGIDALAGHVQLNPGDTEARSALARLLLRVRRLDELIALLKPDVVLGRDTVETHSLLGRAHYQDGDFELARLHLEAAMRLRARLPRDTLLMYDANVIGGHDVKVVVSERWEAEHDRLLLDQIATGEAGSPRARLEPQDSASSPAVIPQPDDAARTASFDDADAVTEALSAKAPTGQGAP